MPTVIIPDNMQPFVISINNHKYVYEAGAEINVPNDVAAEIRRISARKNTPPADPEPTLPYPKADDDDKVVSTSGKKYILKTLPEIPAASASSIGGVKMCANVPEAAGEAPTAEEFAALLSALQECGLMAAPPTTGA